MYNKCASFVLDCHDKNQNSSDTNVRTMDVIQALRGHQSQYIGNEKFTGMVGARIPLVSLLTRSLLQTRPAS